jgi:hypothetical protein
MWACVGLGLLWIIKGALPKRKRESSLRLDVNEQLGRMNSRAEADDEMAVLEDDEPSEPTTRKRKSKKATSQRTTQGRNYAVAVAGTSKYQSSLERICGGRTGSAADKEVVAELHDERENEFDNQAVRVMIEGLKVGYLSRDDARKVRKILGKNGLREPIGIPAMIVGGWYRGDNDRGHFGVRLELFPD